MAHLSCLKSIQHNIRLLFKLSTILNLTLDDRKAALSRHTLNALKIERLPLWGYFSILNKHMYLNFAEKCLNCDENCSFRG